MASTDQLIVLYLIPEFRIDFLNAWLGTVPIALLPIIFRRVFPPRIAVKISDTNGFETSERRLSDYASAVYYLLLIYSLVLPLKPGTNGFYIGMVIYIMAFFSLLGSFINFGKTPYNRLVTRGFYKVSRNPLFLFTSLALLGIGIASFSWLLLLLTAIFVLLHHRLIVAEERICEKKYGKEYLDYKKKIARYFLVF